MGFYGLKLILSLSLAACATVKLFSPDEPVRETPKVSVVGPAPEAAATTASVAKPAKQPIAVATKAEARSPSKPEENRTDTPGDEILLPRDTANNVYFPLGSYLLDREAEAAIKRHAEKLLGDPHLLVTLIGHTDDLGSKEYNDALCIRRANAVRQAFLDLGVASRQIRLSNRYGYEATPPKPCLTDACRKVLRRVELQYGAGVQSH